MGVPWRERIHDKQIWISHAPSCLCVTYLEAAGVPSWLPLVVDIRILFFSGPYRPPNLSQNYLCMHPSIFK